MDLIQGIIDVAGKAASLGSNVFLDFIFIVFCVYVLRVVVKVVVDNNNVMNKLNITMNRINDDLTDHDIRIINKIDIGNQAIQRIEPMIAKSCERDERMEVKMDKILDRVMWLGNPEIKSGKGGGL